MMPLKFCPPFIAALLLAMACQAMASSTPAQTTKSDAKVLPVFVQVDKHGKVTKIAPEIRLDSSLQTLLQRTLSQMITKPAHDAHGHPTASQFIITLALKSSLSADGQYRARFAYLSAKPLALGRWHWVTLKNGKKGLEKEDIFSNTNQAIRTTCFDSDSRELGGHSVVITSASGMSAGSEGANICNNH
ncbi:MAG TPA: hypothetical protein VF269_02735 [Rhodanobacteraceae bacterium]